MHQRFLSDSIMHSFISNWEHSNRYKSKMISFLIPAIGAPICLKSIWHKQMTGANSGGVMKIGAPLSLESSKSICRERLWPITRLVGPITNKASDKWANDPLMTAPYCHSPAAWSTPTKRCLRRWRQFVFLKPPVVSYRLPRSPLGFPSEWSTPRHKRTRVKGLH